MLAMISESKRSIFVGARLPLDDAHLLIKGEGKGRDGGCQHLWAINEAPGRRIGGYFWPARDERLASAFKAAPT